MSVVLSEHLPLLASAPDGIQKLRELILRLATEGRITGSDTSVWTQTTLGETGEWGSGGTPLKAHTDYYGGDIPWLVIGDLNDGLVTAAETHITEKGLANSSAKLVPAGTLLIAMYGSIGKLGIAGIECATNQAIAHCKVNPAIADCRFLFYFVRAIRGQLLASGQGLAQQNISQKLLKATSIQLPPLAEQNRIVAKVDELMALCDRLEAEQADAASAHTRLVETLLGTLTQCADAADLAANWQRLAEHFDTLFTTEASIDALKQTVLQLAVMGKLVRQDPHEKPLAGKLGDFVEFLNGYAFKSEWFTKTGVRLLRNTNIAHGCCDWKDVAHIPVIRLEEFKKFKLVSGDLVLSLDRPLINTGLKFARVSARDLPCLLLQRVAKVSPRNALVEPEYLFLWFNSPAFTRTIDPGRSNGVPHISTKQAAQIPFVRFSVNEQHRIVAKVDELMAFCDRLKTDLVESRTRQARLSATLIESALAAA